MKWSKSRREGVWRDGISCVFLFKMNCTVPEEEEMKMREQAEKPEVERLF